MKNMFSFLLATLGSLSLSAQVPQISLVQLATGYFKPLDIKTCGDQRLFVVEQNGYIRILFKDGTKQTTPFLDIDARVTSTGDEQGLLGLAFSPNYKRDGFFYVNYITGSSPGSTRISRFSVMPNDSTQADPNSEVILLTFSQPYSNHNGGNMMFGPDGYLYVSQGDGGSGNDPQGNGQNRNTFHGKMLRLNVTGQTTYTVPPSNPFVGQANVKEEIWAYGLRNAWRCSFDRLNGDLWMGDVGQDNWEEIDFQDAASAGGGNYGWRCREGLHPCTTCNLSGCTGVGYTEPIYEVPSTSSCSITGGYVYRGTQYGKLFGLYLFTDYCSGNFWSIRKTGANTFDVDTLQDFSNFQYTSFGEDNLGELYIAYRGSTTNPTGRIYRITETTDCNPVAFISFEDSVNVCSTGVLTALRGDTLSYQWYSSTGAINNANSYQYNATQSGWYKVKVQKQTPGCEAMSDSVYITIKDSTALTVANTPLQYCVTAANADISNHVTPTGGVFSGSAVSGTSFVPGLAIVGDNQVSYEYTNNEGCKSKVTFNVEVGDKTQLIPMFTAQDYCIDANPFTLDGFITPVGGTYSGNGVSGNTFSPATAGVGAAKIYYDYTNTFGCVSRDTFGWNVVNCTGVNDLSETFLFSIFPNPSNGKFNLITSASYNQLAELIVTDVTGKVYYARNLSLSLNEQVISIELPELFKGMYTVRLKGERGIAIRSLVIE